jgi:hypothetical protein
MYVCYTADIARQGLLSSLLSEAGNNGGVLQLRLKHLVTLGIGNSEADNIVCN